MTTKNLIKSALVLVMLIASASVFAQQQGMQKKTPEERAQAQTQWMQQNLALTTDQAQKVHDIMLSAATQMESARNGGGDVRSQMQQISATRDEAVKNVLTADQFPKYQQHEQQMQQQRKSRGGMQGGQN